MSTKSAKGKGNNRGYIFYFQQVKEKFEKIPSSWIGIGRPRMGNTEKDKGYPKKKRQK